MSIFAPFEPLAAIQDELRAAGGNPFNLVIEKIESATEAIIKGRRTILVGTNNYLGLSFRPECIEAARTAAGEQGTGTTGSRTANGTYAGHTALEEELAAFFGCPAAIVFSTGYIANLGMLSTLRAPGDVILLDADCHASIYDGCRLGGAEVIRFRHNDVEDMDKRLRRLGERAADTLVVVEGIYSMLGDQAPLREMVEVKDKYGAYLFVDEAHSLGVLGEQGRGLAEELGVSDEVDFLVGTFSKSLGTIGGFCVSRWPELEHVRYGIRPYIFTASSSPSLIAATRAALRILQSDRGLRRRVWDNAHQLYEGLRGLNIRLGPETSPVIAITLDESKEHALQIWNDLLDRGIYVNLVIPPATPSGRCLLRCSLSAAHTPDQIQTITDAFRDLQEPILACQSR